MNFPLENRVAIVTGAGSGIGRGSAIALAAAGARVVINDINESTLTQTRDAILAVGGNTRVVAGDVSRPSDVQALVGEAVAAFGGLDILHANAGVERYELEVMPRRISTSSSRSTSKVSCSARNMRSPRAGSRWRQHRHDLVGAGVTQPSWVRGLRGGKAGVIAAARTLASRSGRQHPGQLDIPGHDRHSHARRDMAGMDLDGAEDFLQRVRDANTLGRIGTPAEVGAAVVFLASDAASYITASNLVVDGGFTAVKSF